MTGSDISPTFQYHGVVHAEYFGSDEPWVSLDLG